MENMHFERAGEASRPITRPEAERKARIMSYLESHYSILSSTCAQLNGCSRYLALKDLKGLMEEGKIVSLGSRNTAQYAAAK